MFEVLLQKLKINLEQELATKEIKLIHNQLPKKSKEKKHEKDIKKSISSNSRRNHGSSSTIYSNGFRAGNNYA